MTPPIAHPLDASFVLAVAAASLVGGTLGAALSLAVAAAYFAVNAYLARKAGK